MGSSYGPDPVTVRGSVVIPLFIFPLEGESQGNCEQRLPERGRFVHCKEQILAATKMDGSYLLL